MLVRRSTIALMLDRYAHLRNGDLSAELRRLPTMVSEEGGLLVPVTGRCQWLQPHTTVDKQRNPAIDYTPGLSNGGSRGRNAMFSCHVAGIVRTQINGLGFLRSSDAQSSHSPSLPQPSTPANRGSTNVLSRRRHGDCRMVRIAAFIAAATLFGGLAGSASVGAGEPPSSPSKPGSDSPAGADMTFALPADRTSARVWTDSTGTRQVEATLLGVEKGTARFKKKDGAEVLLPLDRLNKTDREYIQSLAVVTLFGQSAPKTQEARVGDGLVLVAATLGDKSAVVPGMVFHRDGERAYVVVDDMMGYLANRPDGWNVPRKEVEIAITWDAGGLTKKVRGELLAHYRKPGKWIVAGAASELPSPLFVDPNAVIAEPMKVKIVGYQSTGTGGSQTFARETGEGVLKFITRNARLDVEGYLIDVPTLARSHRAMVMTESGAAIATLTQKPAGYSPRGPGPQREVIQATPLEQMASLLEPHVDHVAFAPRKGDAKRVEYEFVAYVEDPFGRLDAPRLLIRPRTPASDRLSYESGPDGKWQRMDGDVIELALAQEPPSEEAKPLLAAHDMFAQAATWVARHEDDNPGNARHPEFDIQFAYKTRDGSIRYSPAGSYSFSAPVSHFGKPAPQVDIPGLDGTPVDLPKATKHKNGGYQITSERTRVEDAAAGEAPKSPPQPKQVGKSLAGKSRRSDPWEIMTLDLGRELAEKHDRERAPMIFSPDGKWLYLVDGANVLRKIRAADFFEEKSLDIGGTCNDISFSKEGILLAVRSVSAMWIVDGDSLNVVREVPVHGLRLVAGSPATSLGFALGTASKGSDAGREPELSLIDLAKGQVLHRLRRSYGNYLFAVGNTTLFDSPFLIHHMRMCNDGTHLYTGDRKITRFRLEGQDLVMEGSSGELQSGHTTHFVVSDDEKLAAMPTGGGNGGRHAIAVIDPKDFSTKFALANGPFPMAIGFDMKTGDIYSPNSDAMNIFDRRGNRLQQIKWEAQGLNDVHRIIVHPQGGYFIVWAEKSIFVYRRQSK